MAFVDQNEDVPGIILESAALHRIELVNDGSNHIHRSAVDKLDQMLSRGGSCGGQPCMSKGLGDLFIEFFSVCHNNDTRIKAAHFHKDILCHHNHRQGLAAPLCMPNNTALTVARRIVLLNGLDDFFDSKELLITADLFDIGIVKDKVFCECQ